MTEHPPLNLIIAATNFGRGIPSGHLATNLSSLASCDVIVASEPGDYSRPPSAHNLAFSPFSIFYTARPGSDQHGGVLVLCRNSSFASSRIALPPVDVDVQMCAVALTRAGSPDAFCVVIGVYATCYRPDHVRDNAENVSPIVSALDGALRAVQLLHPGIPTLFAGDFNARHTAFGDSETQVRGRKLLEWSLLNGLQVSGAPSFPRANPVSALDLILSPATAQISAPSTRTMLGSDHLAVLVDIEYERTFFYANSLICTSINEDLLVASLEQSLASVSGTPHGQDFRISNALQLAILTAGGEWRRTRRYDARRRPTAEQILAASIHSPWSAVRLLRPESPRIAATVSPAEMLMAFGSAGMQRDHHDTSLPRAPTNDFVRVTPNEVASAVAALRLKACPDLDGISARLLVVAARSPRFLEAFASLLNSSIERGVVSPRWTTSHVIPIPKPRRDTASVHNLRPIYICDALRKLADVCMDRRRAAVFVPHPHQLGFRKGVSLDVVPFALIGIAQRAVERSSSVATHSSQPLITSFFSGATSLPAPNAPSTRRAEPRYALTIAVDFKNAFPGAPAAGIIEGYRDAGMSSDFLSYKSACLSGRRIWCANCASPYGS